MLVNSDLIAFNFEACALRLSAVSSSVGAGTAEMETSFTPPEGQEKIQVGFNPSYFKDAVEVITTKRCRFMFEGPRHAGILKELVTDDSGETVSEEFIYAVMPALLPRES